MHADGMSVRLALGAALLVTAFAVGAQPGRDRARGALLYENHCQACHVSALHVRSDHRAKSRQDVEGWVRHWADHGKLDWSEEDVADVSDFLVKRYYTFPDR